MTAATSSRCVPRARTWPITGSSPAASASRTRRHAEALRRELHEELDIVAEVGALVHSVTHTYPERTVELHFYACSYQGEPKAMIGQQVRWVARDALATLPFPDADAELIAVLASAGR